VSHCYFFSAKKGLGIVQEPEHRRDIRQKKARAVIENTVLNGICPYFTMFPLSFPLSVLRRATEGQGVLDPFCGRGTTNFAARLLKLPTVGIDANAVAAAATEAKMVGKVTPESIVAEARKILRRSPEEVPVGEFWRLAFHGETLERLCRLREAINKSCKSAERKALKGLLLGALHGPRNKNGTSSYFSNQAPRTYAPKPRYAVNFWRTQRLRPQRIDVFEIIYERAMRYYGARLLLLDLA
jgi:DNA methylase